MEDMITSAFQSGNVTAIIAAVVVYVIIYLQRNSTASRRDEDSQGIHDDILKLRFEVDNLKHSDVHKEEILEDLRNQLNILNTNLAKLSVTIEGMEKRNEDKR